MGETTAPVLDPGRGKVKKGFFCAIACDDRSHGSQGLLFHYAPGRGGDHAERFPQGFGGRFLQVDAYEGYDRLTRLERSQGPWLLVHCWSHLRRRFVKLARNTKSPIAEAAIRQIGRSTPSRQPCAAHRLKSALPPDGSIPRRSSLP
jgi:hypothetical protein